MFFPGTVRFSRNILLHKKLHDFLNHFIHYRYIRFPDGTLFDGGRIIYSENELPNITETGVEQNAEFVDSISLERRKIRYKIMLTKIQDTGDIVEFLERPNGRTVCSLQVFFCFANICLLNDFLLGFIANFGLRGEIGL